MCEENLLEVDLLYEEIIVKVCFVLFLGKNPGSSVQGSLSKESQDKWINQEAVLIIQARDEESPKVRMGRSVRTEARNTKKATLDKVKVEGVL